MAGVGFDAAVLKATKDRFRVVSTIPYWISGIYTFFRYKTKNMTITIDGKASNKCALGVIINNGKSFAGGMASDAIPIFRIKEELMKQDIANIESLGVEFHYNTKIDSVQFKSLQNNFNYIFIAVGAQKGKKLHIEDESLNGDYDQLKFLADVLKGEKIELGKKTAIIGGGLSAVDAARTANRWI